MPGYLNATLTLPKTAATGKSSTNLIAEVISRIFSIDAVHGRGLVVEASIFRRQVQSRKCVWCDLRWDEVTR